ncbi:MAG TPA: hypothetical protein VJK52_00005, partial [Candidatus Nanoarchaeia archaeon]|nr:hypothetical protein [Candidatus Nanoarchaeia archaeon]
MCEVSGGNYMKILLLALLTFILACGNAASPTLTCPEGQELIGGVCCVDANNNGQCDSTEPRPAPSPPVQVTPTPPPAAPQPTPQPPADTEMSTQQLLDQIQQVKSYSYSFRDYTYKVMGESVRIDLGKFIRPDGTSAANIVYLNTKTRTAEAYCEGGPTTRRVCEREERGPFTVPYATYAEKLPLTWIEEFADARVVKITRDAQSIGSISTDRWDLRDNGEEISVWVLAKYGVPVRIITPDGEINYVAMSVNTVHPEDMVPHP